MSNAGSPQPLFSQLTEAHAPGRWMKFWMLGSTRQRMSCGEAHTRTDWYSSLSRKTFVNLDGNFGEHGRSVRGQIGYPPMDWIEI